MSDRLILSGLMLVLAAFSFIRPLPAYAQSTEYERAVEARLSGHPEQAIKILEAWLADHPHDLDARLQYGYSLLALERLDEAQSEFEAVLLSAPKYADAREGLAIIASRRARSLPEDREIFVLLDAAISSLEAPQNSWSEFGGALVAPVGESDTVGIRAIWYRRFELEDLQIGSDYTHRASDDVWLRVGVSGTPSADFRPKIAASGGVDYRFEEATVLSFDVAWHDFPAEEVWTVSPGIARYFQGGRFKIAIKVPALVRRSGDVVIGGSIRGDFVPRKRTRLFVGVASGPETDLGLVSDTTSVFGGVEAPVSRALSMFGSVAHEWREIGSDRFEGRVGMKVRL